MVVIQLYNKWLITVEYEGLSPSLSEHTTGLYSELIQFKSSKHKCGIMSTETYGIGEMYGPQQLWQWALYWAGSTTNAYGLSTNNISPIFTSLFATTCLPFSSLYLCIDLKIDISKTHPRLEMLSFQQ